VPTKREREYYAMGFRDGYNATMTSEEIITRQEYPVTPVARRKPKRKLSAWQKFVKANSRKKEFRYRDGKLNLKKMGVAYRRKKRR